MDNSALAVCSSGNNGVALVATNDNPLGVALVNPRKTNKTSDCMDLVELARQVQMADEFVRATAGSKLKVIAEQIRYLQEQACQTLADAKRDSDLNHVACNLVKKPGHIYYLYSNEKTGQKFFSLVAPREWGAMCPHTPLGGYRLELDQSWTPLDSNDEPVKRSSELNSTFIVDNILNARLAINDL